MMQELKDIDQIFWEALQIADKAARETFLSRACGDDKRLLQMIHKLLKAQPHAEEFLEEPFRLGPGTETFALSEQPGSVIGPYKLLQQIGEGGMGVVFMAEQTHPVQRTIALKIIKPGMDTRQVIARFEAERQALAIMDHPNIARVLDAGTTGEGTRSEDRGSSEECASGPTLAPHAGRPYFVMDLVKGIPITDYCNQNQLTIRQRLELLTQVCHAVQHAHHKGIIHRDLKPSNVLVAEYDGVPVPKIIDFGVAKATAQRLTERTMFTQFGQIIGTFEYMSPEQARFNQLDVDTRSDIYSLGVLLYELLAGSTPFERKRFRESELDEALRIIREEEPPRPSMRVTTLAGKAASTIAEQRSSDHQRLRGVLRGELDWIVMKALEKDRNRRYDTAGALAADITHFLADEPVIAGPPSKLYRARKFVRRNRVPVVAATLVATAIVVGVVASTWQAVRATRAERAALASAKQAHESAAAERVAKEQEAAQRKQAEEISHFLINAFDVEYPEHDIQAVAKVLEHSVQELQDVYSDDPAAHAALLATMGRAYVGLRRFGEAEQMYRKCLTVATDAGLIDRVRRELSTCLLRDGKYEEGVAILQEFFLEKIRRTDSSDAIELREAWPKLSDSLSAAGGKPGMGGLELDGDRDYVILPRVYFDGRPPWTLEAIVRPVEIDQSVPASVSPVGWTSLISATDGGAMGLETSRRRWSVSLYTTRVPTDDWRESYSVAIARNEVSLRQWQHVAGVWDGKELRLYLNGQLQDTRGGVDYCSTLSMAPMFLGADPDNAVYGDVAQGYLRGRLRAARLSRSAEYTDSFPSPQRLENTPGTIGLYDFTIDNGRYAFDRSGHENHGIIIGAKFATAESD